MKHNQKMLSVMTASLLLMLLAAEASAAVKQLARPGEFQIVTSGDGTRVWRINTLTGELLYCSPEEDSELPVCTRVEIPEQPGGRTAPKKY